MVQSTLVSWENSATVQPTKAKRRTRASAPVNYPIFREASQYTEDPEWVNILIKAERGQFPTGFSYAKDTLWYRSRNGGEDIKLITTIDPGEFFNEVRDFMNSHGFVTKLDRITPVKEENKIDPDDWITLPQRYRQALLDKFIRTERSEKKLNTKEVIQLLASLRKGFSIGAINRNNDIKIEKFRIVEINGLLYDDDKRIYYIDPTFEPIIKSVPRKKAPGKNSTKGSKTYHDYWDLFLKEEAESLRFNKVTTSFGASRKRKITSLSNESESEDNNSSTI
jgi:hypothetical protein